tara:strand:- start:18 stop:818 length:801 start_codon:yes stop_codon:yes gene_type:complete
MNIFDLHKDEQELYGRFLDAAKGNLGPHPVTSENLQQEVLGSLRKLLNLSLTSIDEEIWEPVWGFPGYEISNLGRVKSYWKVVGNNKGHRQRRKVLDQSLRKYVKQTNSVDPSKNYQFVHLSRDSTLEDTYPLTYYNKLPINVRRAKSKKNPEVQYMSISVHKLVIWHFNPLDKAPKQIGISTDEWSNLSERVKEIIQQSLEINHIDQNPENNRLDNLEWVTKTENMISYFKSSKFQKNSKKDYLNVSSLKDECIVEKQSTLDEFF